MPKEYTREQLWELYKKLPERLREAMWSEKATDNVWRICERNNIEKFSNEITKYIGDVLLGILLPEDFQQVLEKELHLVKETAKKVSQEIHRFIFYPVKSELEELYITKTAKSTESSKQIRPKEKIEIEEKSEEPSSADVYREPVE